MNNTYKTKTNSTNNRVRPNCTGGCVQIATCQFDQCIFAHFPHGPLTIHTTRKSARQQTILFGSNQQQQHNPRTYLFSKPTNAKIQFANVRLFNRTLLFASAQVQNAQRTVFTRSSNTGTTTVNHCCSAGVSPRAIVVKRQANHGIFVCLFNVLHTLASGNIPHANGTIGRHRNNHIRHRWMPPQTLQEK